MRRGIITRLILMAGILLFINLNYVNAQCPSPTNLHVTNLTPTSGLFEWNNSLNSTGYVFRIKPTGSVSWRRIVSGNNSETVTGLLPNTSYQAKVRSDCSGVEGSYSAYFTFTTPSNNVCQLPNVYYFTSDNITTNSCLVGWNTVLGAINYNVRYKIRYSSDPWITGTSNSTSLQLTGLNPHTQYEFQVQSVCSSGSAAFSSSGIFTTKLLTCAAPNGLTANNVTDSTATLGWNNSSCSVSYQIEYAHTGQAWTSDTTSGVTFPLTNLTSGTSYSFRVQGVTSTGAFTGYSTTFSFNTSSGTCDQPSNLAASNVTTNGATIDWTAVSGAVSYNVRYRLAGAASWQTVNVTSNSTTLSGLTADNAYEFQVQTQCSGGPGSFAPTATFVTPPNISSAHIPVPDHVVICILENKAYQQLLGSSLTPHINALASDTNSAVFGESYGITHPSQPNYIHFFSGGNQGITNNGYNTQKFTTPNLAAELINAGRTFVTYSEGLPSVGYDGEASGKYRRRHNAVANWMGTGTNQVPATVNQPFTSFPTNFDNLPTVSIVVPDLDHGMHDGTLGTALATGDTWISANLDAYIQWAKTHNSVFILTCDEDDGSHSNRILTVISGQMVSSGLYTQSINHYNLLRTIEEMYGLNFIGASANAAPIHGIWTNGFRMAEHGTEQPIVTEDRSGWSIFPNPSRGELHVGYELTQDAPVTIKIYSGLGGLVYEKKVGPVSKGKHIFDMPSDKRLSTGVYYVAVNYGEENYIKKFIVSE